ncbi:oligopeptide transport system substrate-binding protein [Litorivivens lipolytica]|uniref:Oligopeptide transport system substrate-binding protein n=1 Tax=Litorivivens lipolytica TaxID=1524264 RepID=A0A7W4Z696_9GAMM|nr:peptide ABC transporter substrate-binding protein [Litorivivens lipolytica]MBB3046715.1 oligopeptide transport system substrate-binding protein [Litorivivens lipolytica]
MRKCIVATVVICLLFPTFVLAGAVNAQEQRITLSLATEPPSLDTALATDQISSFLLAHLMEGLVQYGPAGELVPAMAERWEVREGGATFWLRKNAVWSDGKPVTAEHFVYAWRRALDPATASQYAFILFPIKNAEAVNRGELPVEKLGVEALGNYRLEVRFDKPCPYFAKLTAFMTFFPARQDVVERWGRAHAADADKMIFNGPFILTRWIHGARLTLTRNPRYWNADAIRLQEIDLPYITTDPGTHYNLYKDNRIALAPLDASTLSDALSKGYETHLFDFGTLYFLEMNFREDRPTRNLALRKAIQSVLNPSLLVYKVLGLPGVKPAYSLFPSSMRAGEGVVFSEHYPPPVVNYDIAQAQRYLAQAKRELGDIPPLTLLVGDSPRAVNEAEFYQYVLKQSLGLETRLDQQTFKQRISKMRRGEFDIAAAGWGPDFDDPITFGDLFASWNENNRGRFADDDYDAAVRQAQRSLDPAVRLKAFDRMQQIISEQVVIIPTYENVGLYVQHPQLMGVRRSIFGGDPNYRYAWVKP